MQADQRDRVVVVLVRARNPSNIGAVARAMHDFGFSRLRIVNEFSVPFAAAKSAVDAGSVLEAATEHTALADAVADCTLVLGTTAVGERVVQHPLYILPDAATRVREALAAYPEARVALLFGSEKTGLSNEELSFCHALLTIPMHVHDGERHLSMNLGQAAAVCLYQLAIEPSLAAQSFGSAQSSGENAASAGELERVYELMRQVLELSGYARRHPANAREASVRRMVYRMGMSITDATAWAGILRQLLHRFEPKSGADTST